VAALALSQPMGRVTSSLFAGLLKEIYGLVVDEPANFALHLGWCLTASHWWKRLNSKPLVLFLYRSEVEGMDIEDIDMVNDMTTKV
jgi:hypothetical protein